MRTMQRYTAILVMLMLSFVNSWADGAMQYPFRHLTTDDGLLNNEIIGLQYDRHGILWIETQTGWNTWDGNAVKTVGKDIITPTEARTSTQNIQRWKNLTLPNKSSVANTVLDIKDDGCGNLWIATDHEGVFIYNKQTKLFLNLVNSPSNPTTIAENHVSVIAIARDGTVALGLSRKEYQSISRHHSA